MRNIQDLFVDSKVIAAVRSEEQLLVDSTAIETGTHSVRENQPDAVEVMPGLLPRVLVI